MTDWRKEAERLAEALEKMVDAVRCADSMTDRVLDIRYRESRSALSHFQALKEKAGD